MPQVSGYISDESKILFENFSKQSGQKKGFILEQAILQYISAQQELPNDVLIPSSITVSKETFKNTIMADKEPTSALTELMNEHRD